MSDFRYFRRYAIGGTASVDYYRADPDRSGPSGIRVSRGGLWVQDVVQLESVTDLMLDARDHGRLLDEVPVDEVPCHLCMVAAGTVLRQVVHTWADALVIVPRPAPVVPGHLLVIPTVHVQHALVDIDVSTQVHRRALTYAAQHLADGDLNVLSSKGRAATQTEPHLHYHLVPRVEGDGLPLLWDRGEVSRG